MAVHWSDRWIGLPYAPVGRGPAYDCLGLFATITRARRGISIVDPACGVSGLRRARTMLLRNWSDIGGDTPIEGDAAVFRIAGAAFHVGYMIDARHMLHIEDEAGSQVERIDGLTWSPRKEGIYRHV